MPDNFLSHKERLADIIKLAVAQDAALREQYAIGDKFRFIRDRLQALQESVDAELATIKDEAAREVDLAATADEVVVYVYLFNAQGMSVPTWKKMVHPSVLYEYSVNRPIYPDESAIQAVIRDKTNRQQHAYLAVAVKKESILPLADDAPKDPYGQTLIRVKEGALRIERVLFLKHNGNEYHLSEAGELIKTNA